MSSTSHVSKDSSVTLLCLSQLLWLKSHTKFGNKPNLVQDRSSSFKSQQNLIHLWVSFPSGSSFTYVSFFLGKSFCWQRDGTENKREKILLAFFFFILEPIAYSKASTSNRSPSQQLPPIGFRVIHRDWSGAEPMVYSIGRGHFDRSLYRGYRFLL